MTDENKNLIDSLIFSPEDIEDWNGLDWEENQNNINTLAKNIENLERENQDLKDEIANLQLEINKLTNSEEYGN